MERPGTWNVATSHANDANLRVMIANPHDLVKGRGEDTSAGAEAAPPVARLLAGKRYQLPVENTSSISSSAQPQPQGGANPNPNQ
jgi:type IV pilus biogenesis protein CpaD/CtpE